MTETLEDICPLFDGCVMREEGKISEDICKADLNKRLELCTRFKELYNYHGDDGIDKLETDPESHYMD